MNKKLILVSIIILFLIASYFGTKGKVARIKLPEGATIEDAQEILKIVVADDFQGKILRKFANLVSSKHKINLNLEEVVSTNEETTGRYITFSIYYTGTLANAK